MLNPSPTLSNVIVAVVSSFSADNPAAPSCPESAIVKQPACAAASSSSGLVPTPFSNRVLKEYCVCLSTPLSVEMVPLPSFKQTQYSFSTRFENGVGTNPEELLAAAHAGCFTMALSAQLGNAGMTASRLET